MHACDSNYEITEMKSKEQNNKGQKIAMS